MLILCEGLGNSQYKNIEVAILVVLELTGAAVMMKLEKIKDLIRMEYSSLYLPIQYTLNF